MSYLKFQLSQLTENDFLYEGEMSLLLERRKYVLAQTGQRIWLNSQH